MPLQKGLLEDFKCGADFLPSPLASKPRFALKANAVLTMRSLLTAVAVAVENDHTIAFLGNNKGDVFKVELFSDLFLFSTFSLKFLPVGRTTPGLKTLCLMLTFCCLPRYTWPNSRMCTAQCLVTQWERRSTRTCSLTSVTATSTLQQRKRFVCPSPFISHIQLHAKVWTTQPL